MDLTDTEIEELVTRRALGSIDPVDDQRLTRALDRRPDLDRLLTDIEANLVALDHRLTTTPPPGLRQSLLAGLVYHTQLSEAAPAPIEQVFNRQVEALAGLLADLDDDDWDTPALPYSWTVHGLVAHLAVIEDYTAHQLGLIDSGPVEADHLEMGHHDIEAELTVSPRQTMERWAHRARATSMALSHEATLPEGVSLHGWPLGSHGSIVARSFELWTHTDDILRAIGRSPTTPIPEDLRTMSSFSVRALPFTLAFTAPGTDLPPTRLVLTGAGGATFDIGQPASGETDPASPSNLIVLDVVDYCRVVARRLDPDDLDHTVTGDPTLARALLESASAFAV